MRILLLEDNPADAELIENELRGVLSDFVLFRVETEEAFSKELLESPPDIILSDYDLPLYNGAIALAVAKQKCPDIPFILVTGAVSEDRAIEILTSGARDYVLKNRLHRLVPAVRRALAESEEHRARKEAETELRKAHKTLEERVKLRTAELEAEMAARIKMEQALRDSERREHDRAEELAAMLEAVPIPVFIVHDPDSLSITGNRAADELLSQPRGAEASLSAPPELKPRHFRAVKDGRELRLDELPAQRAARGENVKDFEFSLVFDDGTIRHVLGYGTPFSDQQGQPRGAVHALVDITERKQDEETLRREHDFISKVMETAGALVVVLDREGRITEFNRACEQISGYSFQEVRERAIWDLLISPEELAGVQAKWNALINGTFPIAHENAWLSKDGTWHIIAWQNTVLTSVTGEVQYVIGTGIDITERKRIEDDLRKSEQQFRTLADSIPNLAWWANGDGYITWYNQRWYEYTGTTPAQMEGWGWQKVHDPKLLPQILDQWNEALATGQAAEIEFPLRGADGVFRPFLTRVIPLKDSAGRVLRWFGTNTDISALKQSEEALREVATQAHQQLEEIQSIYNSAHTGLCVLDRSLRYVRINERLAEINGFPVSDHIGKAVRDIVPNIASLAEEVTECIIRTGEPALNLEFTGETPSHPGVERTFLGHWLPLKNTDGYIFGFNVVIEEITERKQAEERLIKSEELLRETNKELESFSYSVSHDLQSPLRAIKGFSSMILKEEALTGAETKRKLAVIQENAEKMQRLIEDLLLLSRVGRQKLSRHPIDMDALVKDVWKDLATANSDKPLKLKTNELRPAYGDQTLIRQVLANLLSNAIKYSANRKPIEVEIGSRQENDGNVYYVKDKGVGFDMKYYDKLFGVFQRLHGSEFEGTGIGLSIAQRIIHLHGGKIWAKSKLDKGAVFYFQLPGKK
jgi:hypothetical protein